MAPWTTLSPAAPTTASVLTTEALAAAARPQRLTGAPLVAAGAGVARTAGPLLSSAWIE